MLIRPFVWLLLSLPAVASAQEETLEIMGSSGKYFPMQEEACTAAQNDAIAIARDTCTRKPGFPGDATTGDCTCEQGGFEEAEWLCSAKATMSCTLNKEAAPVAPTAPTSVKLVIKPPSAQDPLEVASYAFKRRGESLPADLLEGRFQEACAAGWELGCHAGDWVTGGRHDLRKAAPEAEKACNAGDPTSCIIQGWALEQRAQLSGDGQDYRDAAKIYKNLCDSRKHARACYEYGTILFNNLGVTTSPILGIRRWDQACDLGSASACTVLAKIHRLGLKTTADPSKAASYAEKACAKADPAGCLEDAYAKNEEAAIVDARIGYCVSGGVDECWEMATTYLGGTQPEPRPGLARALLSAGCELAHAPSCSNAARVALEANDDEMALSMFRKSCELGEVSGCSGVAEMIITERAEGDVKSEQYAFEVACSKGEMPAACSMLGLALLEERRLEDRPRARALLRQSCVDATSPAKPCFVLGDMYETGAGGERDRTLAARYYKWACTQGWGEACERRGDLLDGGVGVREDDGEAVVMYQAACDRGLAMGCHKAAVLLDEGTNIERDPKRALELFESGCEKKVGDSCLRVGLIWLEGAVEGRDEAKARQAFDQAVSFTNVEAHRRLAYMLWNGVGGKKDKKRAKELAAAGCQLDDAIACRGAPSLSEDN